MLGNILYKKYIYYTGQNTTLKDNLLFDAHVLKTCGYGLNLSECIVVKSVFVHHKTICAIETLYLNNYQTVYTFNITVIHWCSHILLKLLVGHLQEIYSSCIVGEWRARSSFNLWLRQFMLMTLNSTLLSKLCLHCRYMLRQVTQPLAWQFLSSICECMNHDT